tara:strand:- start:6074 stop:6430 length:357 start_codon:yes stop_codon:yes gene_type:complete
MDPNTWVTDGSESDDEQLRQSDLNLMLPVFEDYLRSNQAGAIAIFCYELRSMATNSSYGLFRDAIAAAASTLQAAISAPVHHVFLEANGHGGNRHVGGLISADLSLLNAVTQACLPLL